MNNLENISDIIQIHLTVNGYNSTESFLSI